MTRLVCLGDSFTEGMCDEDREDGRFLGWADRVAQGLADARVASEPVQYANLAIRGKLLRQVVAEQVPVAVAMEPDLITFHAGPNDVLRPGADLDPLLVQYEQAVVRLLETGARVVLFTSLTRAGGSGRFADRLEARFTAFNRRVRKVAARHGCLLVDDETVHALADRRFWAVDRLHLNAQGHARVAANVLHALGVSSEQILGGPVGWWEQSLPPAAAVSRRQALAADAQWVRVHFLPWVGRRLRRVSSGDGMQAKDPALRTVVANTART